MRRIRITFFAVICLMFSGYKHPFYLSVCVLKYNANEHILEGSVKIFINDMEDALSRLNKIKVDLYNPKDSAKNNLLLNEYLNQHLKLNINNKAATIAYIGSEREEELIWLYFEIKNCKTPKHIQVENKILFDFITEQMNIVQVQIADEKKSNKTVNPESKSSFEF